VEGVGAHYNPDRRQALETIRIKSSLEAVLKELTAGGRRPRMVVTSARRKHSDLSYNGLRRLVSDGVPVVLLFGTAWGLADDLMEGADYRLAPIAGGSDYNHLSVRSAVSIVLDRTLGGDE
jgi:hypothetical protein